MKAMKKRVARAVIGIGKSELYLQNRQFEQTELARGLFCLSRSVGILAHAWEQSQQGGRNKGPTPPGYRWTYTGDQG